MSPQANEALYIGLMSGTSIDAIDAVLIQISDSIKIIDSHSYPIPQTLKNTILALCSSGENEIQRAFELDRELGQIFANCTLELCEKAGVPPNSISAIGSHGQTIRHSPQGDNPFTLQIADPNTIAEVTGITTVADFRRRDIAAGGQGAPLVPAFHENAFKDITSNRAIINIGGMANITIVAKSETPTLGFDTGPGNVLLDYWIYKQRSEKFDRDGKWATSGEINAEFLSRLLSEPYLKLPHPKSTGRELFNPDWLEHQLLSFPHLSHADVQASIAELTCRTIADAVMMCDSTREPQDQVDEVYVCGGGARNSHILKRLKALLPNKKVTTTTDLGIAPELVESIAFAWLAYRTMHKLSGNLTSVTGAHEERILGAIYWGN